MEKLWLLIVCSIYFALVFVSLLYYIIITVGKRDRISDQLLRSLATEPFVSIIVPTYNEEKNIQRCLTSLRQLNYSNFEIIVSDGGSKDNTISIARPLANQIIVDEKLPEDWIGKNYGCHLGYKAAKGSILLFTDADTTHSPDSLRIAVSMLLEKKAGLLTIFPYQQLQKWWESIVPIHFFLSHFVSGGPRQVNDPRRTHNYVALGQYMMFSREAYEKIGGHARLYRSIIEDYAFARVIKTELQSLYYLRSSKLVYTRMYPDSFMDCWNGFKKVLYAGIKLTPPRRIVFTLIYIFWGILSPVAIVLTAIYAESIYLIIAPPISLGLLILTFVLVWTNKGRHFWITYLFFPILMIVFIISVIASMVEMVVRKTTTWKGRKYTPDLNAGLEDGQQVQSSTSHQNIFESNL
ncbi:MAG TPA: glycosyltransferase [Candidatus Bathyarchaeia archaeon]|nr:glycosyltransferase [Candidatus Bathyarchaeia archaeon]